MYATSRGRYTVRFIHFSCVHVSRTDGMQSIAGEAAPRRVLTVGDGDLSFSLALARAFSERVHLTATTLLTEPELLATYERAAECIAALRSCGHVRIVHGVNACMLHTHELGTFDDVYFNHPHLGLEDLRDVEMHARRHRILIAHYLGTAATLLPQEGGRIRLTLCGNQPSAWAVIDHASRLFGADVVTHRLDVNNPPPAALLCADAPPQPPEPDWASRRRFRTGELGCKHWLSKFGFEHRRSEGNLDMRVDRSVEMVWEVGALERRRAVDAIEAPTGDRESTCAMCGFSFPSAIALAQHVSELGRPVAVEELRAWRSQERKQVGKGDTGGINRASDPKAAAEPTAAHVCSHCGASFTSRNALFAHLAAMCDPAAGRTRPKVGRLALCIGYVGVGRHGVSELPAEEEAERPTIGGIVVAAARRVWEEQSVGCEQTGDSAEQFTVAPLVRTEKGVSATHNWLILSIHSQSLPTPHVLNRKLERVDAELRDGASGRTSGGVRLLNAGHAAVLDGRSADTRHAAERLVFRYALPYTLLLLPSERCALGGDKGVWLTRLADGATREGLALLLESLHMQPCTVVWPECGGFAELGFGSCAEAEACVSALDRYVWMGTAVIAMAASEAHVKLAVHHRVKEALRRLSTGPEQVETSAAACARAEQEGGAATAQPPLRQKRRARTFHNFSSERARLRGTSAPLLVLQRCYSAIQEDVRAESGAAWAEDCLVLVFAAREFAPQQVRRMSATVAAVTADKLEPSFIDSCFEDADVRTPLAPAEAMWCDSVSLAPKVLKAWAPAHEEKSEALEAREAIRTDVLQAVSDAARAAAQHGWLEVELARCSATHLTEPSSGLLSTLYVA